MQSTWTTCNLVSVDGVQKNETVMNIDKVRSIRRTLDKLRPNEVSWDPYVNYRDNGVVHAMAFYSGTLKYMDVVEPYHPERILRQFGHVQSIPDPPYHPLESHRGPSTLKYYINYGFQQDNWERWRNHLLAPEVRAYKARFEFLATLDVTAIVKCRIYVLLDLLTWARHSYV